MVHQSSVHRCTAPPVLQEGASSFNNSIQFNFKKSNSIQIHRLSCRKAPPRLPSDVAKPMLRPPSGVGRPGSQERSALAGGSRNVVLFEEGQKSDEEDNDVQVGGRRSLATNVDGRLELIMIILRCSLHYLCVHGCLALRKEHPPSPLPAAWVGIAYAHKHPCTGIQEI